MDNPIRVAAEAVGTQRKLAEILGVPPSFVSQWVSGYRKVPPVHCQRIEEVSGGRVTCHQLRPDIYPKPKAA